MPRAEQRIKPSAAKRLVVDASELRAASPEESTHPIGSRCRDMLEVILQEGHGAAVTDDIMDEWNRHDSRSARRWRLRMSARRRIVKVIPADCTDVVTALRVTRLLSEPEIAAAENDMHLVAAARSADHSVLSLDEITRAILRKLTAGTRVIDRLLWANPANEYQALHGWLTGGEPAAPQWLLSAQTAAKEPRRPRRGPKGGQTP